MIKYWKEDTETEIGTPFDLEKHDKEISDRWLDKLKQARSEIQAESFAEHCEDVLTVELRDVLEIIDKLIEESEE